MLKSKLEGQDQTGASWNPFRNPSEDDLYTSIMNQLEGILNINIDSHNSGVRIRDYNINISNIK